jgi:hypothetical protein
VAAEEATPGTDATSHDRLPALVLPEDSWCETIGEPVSVQRRRFLLLPFVAPVAGSRAQRCRVVIGRSPARSGLIFGVRGRAALAVDPGEFPPGGKRAPVFLRLRAPKERLRRMVPRDMVTALARRGLRLDVLPDHEARQLLLLVSEARDADVRAERLRAAVAAIERMTDVQT